ncbi:MAG: nitroreductase family protein [Candidatus Woesearchaeota archaeon]
MKLEQALLSRRSIRRYLQIPVEREKWVKMLHAAQCAPSSGNLQNWKFIIVTDQKKRLALAHDCHDQMWMSQAPLHIVVLADTQIAHQYYHVRGERLYTVQNCAAAIQNMLLQATQLKLATCWVSSFEEHHVREHLSIPDHLRPQAIITVGYPDEIVPAPAKKKLKDITFFEEYGVRRTKEQEALERMNYADFFDAKISKVGEVWQGFLTRLKELFSR